MSGEEHTLSLEAIQKIQSSVKFLAWALGTLLTGAIAAAVWVTQMSDRQADLVIRVAAMEQQESRRDNQLYEIKTDVALLKQSDATNTSTLNRIAIRVGAGLPEIK